MTNEEIAREMGENIYVNFFDKKESNEESLAKILSIAGRIKSALNAKDEAATTAQSDLAREVLAEVHGQGTLNNTGLCDLRYVTRRLRDLFTHLGVKIGD